MHFNLHIIHLLTTVVSFKMLKLLILTTLCNIYSASFMIDYPLTKMITINDTSAYFGYSILLQKGSPSIAIVGAPGKKHGRENTGSVYKCNLNNLTCSEYNRFSRIKGIYPAGKNGDMLGSVLAGDDTAGGKLFTCAPRFTVEYGTGDYFTNGRCFYIKDSNNINENARLLLPLNFEKQVSKIARTFYYDAAYGEVGFDIAYGKDRNEILTGAPGKALWSGGIVRTNLISVKNDVFSLYQMVMKYQDNYAGYAVAWGKFKKGLQSVWYVSGAPRGSDLMGHVVFIEQSGVIKAELFGEEIGSYFGSSLLVIHKKKEGDDILIGAPMYSGSSFDEGLVYYYRNDNSGTFHPPVKLSNKKSSSRFGTSMAAIGDIDLDSFVDCAIAAPYEDDGIGAVYLYFGSSMGFSEDNFYRISPSHFAGFYPQTFIRGFGMGLSNGIDVDNNNHTDIAIGAYLSGQVFYFTTKPIFDVSMNLTSNTNILYTSSTNFSVTFCISFNFRNGDRTTKVQFFTRLVLEDERILNRKNITKNISLKGNDVHCMSDMVFLKRDHLNVEPLTIPYGYRHEESKDPLIENIFTIPVSYECGSDNICQTKLSINSKIDTPEIIFGKDNELKVNITVTNIGETAYQTKLHLKVLPEISLINMRECDFENGSYICLVSQKLNGMVEKHFIFDLANIEPSWTILPIDIRVESVGQDADPSDNEQRLKIPVVLQNNPDISSRSTPERMFLNKSEDILKISHSFLVGNHGPSPLDLNLTIIIPQFKTNKSKVLEITSIEGNVDNIPSKCYFSVSKPSNLRRSLPLNKENGTIIKSCLDPSEQCTVVVCEGGFMPKSNKNAVFTLKLAMFIKPLVEIFEDKTKLIFISSAYCTNGTTRFHTTASTLIVSTSEALFQIPLYIYLSSIISGLVLLMLLILVLYKCNFFKRSYKEMIENEQSEENREATERIIEENEF